MRPGVGSVGSSNDKEFQLKDVFRPSERAHWIFLALVCHELGHSSYGEVIPASMPAFRCSLGLTMPALIKRKEPTKMI
jgi:hypothetical protein